MPDALKPQSSDKACPCCGYQFGYDDTYRRIAYHQWRAQWMASGMPWFSSTDRPPHDWDPNRQLERVRTPVWAAERAQETGAFSDYDVAFAELDRWHWIILDDEWTAKQMLDESATKDRLHLAAVCRQLLWDDSPIIQRIALQKLAQHTSGEAIDIAAEMLWAGDWHVRGMALSVLTEAATLNACRALAVSAEMGCGGALTALSRCAQSPDARIRLLRLARSSLLSEQKHLRHAAIVVIAMHANVPDEEERLLEAARRYHDRTAVRALTHGTARVLPGLRRLLSQLERDPLTAEAVERTIMVINKRQHSR